MSSPGFSNQLSPRYLPVARAQTEMALFVTQRTPAETSYGLVFEALNDALRQFISLASANANPSAFGLLIIEEMKRVITQHELTPSETVFVLARLLAREADYAVAAERTPAGG